jgi:hypothetical protein
MGIIRYLSGWRNLDEGYYKSVRDLLSQSNDFSEQQTPDNFPVFQLLGYEMRTKKVNSDQVRVELATIKDSMRIVSESFPYVGKTERGTLTRRQLSSALNE